MALKKTKVAAGWIEGLPSDCPQYTVFKGVPYAAPPVGELRWKAPQPVEPWDGVYQAYKFAKIPMQARTLVEGDQSIIQHEMSEDCLYLDIWTPAQTPDEKLPVAFYIPGGGYNTGYSHRYYVDGDGFAKRGIVMVSISYRLNVFGFLAHPELSAEAETKTSGNYGTLDMVAALKWVYENISAFGGDPTNITVFGQSAGAGGSLLMCTSPLTRGMVKRGITQSGGGMQKLESKNHETLEAAEKMGEKFFETMGIKTVAEARAMSAEAVLDAMIAAGKQRPSFTDGAQMGTADKAVTNAPPAGFGSGIRFRSIIDGYVLPEQEYRICQKGEHHDIDYLMGACSDEMVSNIYSTLAFAKNELMVGRKPMYLYRFSHVPSGTKEAYHGADLEYVFQTLKRSTRPNVGADFELSTEMSDRWAAFMKTGNPNPEGKDYPEWTPFTEDKPLAYNFGPERVMMEVPENDLIKERVAILLDRN